MVRGLPGRCVRFVLLSALAAATPAQDAKRWITDLGDPERGEAAERALIELGSKAVQPLEAVLEAWDRSSPREVERLRAALRTVDQLGAPAADLMPLLLQARIRDHGDLHDDVVRAAGSLIPYAKCELWHQFWRGGGEGEFRVRQANFVSVARLNARSQVHVATVEEALKTLAGDALFEREVAAEFLGLHPDPTAIEPLAARLLDRDRQPQKLKQYRHNGFPMEVQDRFALRCAIALVRIAPDDPRSVVGHAVLAASHPYRSVRQEALRSLGRFGPEVETVVPELLQIAGGGDVELTIEAIKVLGMADRKLAPHLAAITALAANPDRRVARLASALVARLRAMGAELAPAAPASGPTAAATAVSAALQRAVDAIDDSQSTDVCAAENELLAAPAASWPLLVNRYQRQWRAAPEALVRLIGRIGRSLPGADTDAVRNSMGLSGEVWNAPNWSAHCGGGPLREGDAEAYAMLTISPATKIEEAAGFLDHKNAAIRLVAARDLVGLRAQVANAARTPGDGAKVADLLLEATRADHPDKSPFECGPGQQQVTPLDLDRQIQAAAAAALLDCDLAADVQATLLGKILPFEDPAIVAEAITRWTSAAAQQQLTDAASDPRPAVAQAATAALARLSAGK